MAQPVPFTRSYSFGDNAYSGSQVDQQFDRAKVTLDQILNNLELIQRDDGEIANQTVGYDQFKPEVQILFTPPTAWENNTLYTARVSTIFQGDSFYQALVTHTSGVFATDLAAGKWVLIADFGDLFVASLAAATQDEVHIGVEDEQFVTPATLRGLHRVSDQGTDYAVISTDFGKVVAIDASGGARTVTLPSAVTAGNGARVTIVKKDPSINFVTINTVGGELLGYPGTTYNFHATPATAVSNNGGFVRITIAAGTENRVFRTGEKARISGAVGFAALNADHIVERPPSSSGVSHISLDLTVPYVAGYTSGGTVAWVCTSTQLRICNGALTVVSDGEQWVVEQNWTGDAWLGPKDQLFSQRNPDYDDTALLVAGSVFKDLDLMHSAHNNRLWLKSIGFGEMGDPVDIRIARFFKDGLLSTDAATSLPAGGNAGSIYWQGSNQNGTAQLQGGNISGIAAEDITTVASGFHVRIGSTRLGSGEATFRIDVRENGDTYLGGTVTNGSLVAKAGGGVPASSTLTAAANPADGDTVTIDTVVYTFETGSLDVSTPTAVDVRVGASAEESLANLIKAVNTTGTAGTHYGTSTTRHTTCYAMAVSTDRVLIHARTPGTAGNSIVIGETGANLSWASAAIALSGGESAAIARIEVKGDMTPGANATVRTAGSASAVGMKLQCQGAAAIGFYTRWDTTERLQFEVADTATAANYLSVTGSAAGSPAMTTKGADTNIGIRISTKGTAPVALSDPLTTWSAAASFSTAGNVSYTAAQFIGGVIVRDCNGGSRTDVLPAAADLVAALPGCAANDTIRCSIINGSDAAETITLTEGAGGAYDANQTAASRLISQNSSKTVYIRLTVVGAGSEAYVVYA